MSRIEDTVNGGEKHRTRIDPAREGKPRRRQRAAKRDADAQRDQPTAEATSTSPWWTY